MSYKGRAYVGGTFDVPHYGHFRLFKRLKEEGYDVIVSLNTDEFNKRFKGKKPLMDLNERMESVKACRYVDEVIINVGDEDSTQAILFSQAKVVVHGTDWTGEELKWQMGITEKFLDDNFIKMKYVPYTKGISTTEILKRARKK